MAAQPAPSSPTPAVALVGRERELVTLREALAAALAGRGSLVLIGGEAGIGKTALAEALLAEAVTRGALVLVGRCFDLTETPPYGPWRDLFDRAPRAADLPPLPATITQFDLSETEPTSQQAIIVRVCAHLDALAAKRPLVLLLEDVHWADPASLDLLRVIARRLQGVPLLAIATYRADELTRHQPLYALLPALVREARASQLAPARLTGDDLGDLVRARYALGAWETARLVAHLHERSHGNPFFANEVLRSLEDARVIARTATGWSLGSFAALPVPALLRRVIDGRVARLGADAERLLALAAVIGDEVPLALWEALGEVGEAALGEVVERALAARVLAEVADTRRVRFAHALIREALYEGLALPRRRRAHRRVAEILLTTPAGSPDPDPDAIAAHLQRAGDERATAWLIRAGERAWRAAAWLTAADRFEAALALLGQAAREGERRGHLLLRLALLRRFSAPREGVALLDEAEHLAHQAADAPLAAFIVYARGHLRGLADDRLRGMAEVVAGMALLEAIPVEERRRLAPLMAYGNIVPGTERGLVALLLAVNGRLAEALAAGERTIREAAILGAEARGGGSYLDAWFGLFIARALLGDPAAARRAYEGMRDQLRTAGHYHGLWLIIVCALELLCLPYHADDLAWRRALADEAEAMLARTSGATPAGFHPTWARVPLAWVAGEWAALDALPWGDVARRRGAELPFIAAAMRLAEARGRPDDAGVFVRQVLPDGPASAPGSATVHTGPVAQRVAASLALGAGDLPGARAWLEAHDRWLAWSGATLGRAEGHLGWAAYHRAAGDLAPAREAAARALATATAPRQPLALLAAHRLLGELATVAGRHDDAAAQLDAALALADACAAPYERALTLLARAELLGATGATAAALADLGTARATCAALGATPALARAAALAARLQVPAAPVRGGLSARELAVLRLVAEGLADAQVAERLSISPRTVGQHLRSIYGKLEVSSRTAAARFATDHGLA